MTSQLDDDQLRAEIDGAPHRLPRSANGHDDQASPPTARPFDAVWADDLTLDLADSSIVEGVLGQQGLSVLYGDSNTGKTFVAIDLACSVATGRTWHGLSVQPGPTLYIAAEAPKSIERRVIAWRQHHRVETLPLLLLRSSISFLDPGADVAALISMVNDKSAEKGPFKLIVVDTLSRVMAGGSENAPEIMTAVIGHAGRLQAATGAHVMFVHHSGKDQTRGSRGHSSLRAATDTELEVTPGSIRVAKARDDAGGKVFGFRLEKVELGTTDAGRPLTTCVALACEPTTADPKKTRALGANEKIVLDALLQTLDRYPASPPFPDEIPTNKRVTRTQDLEACAIRILPHPEQKHKNQAFKLALSSLQASHAIHHFAGYVWR